MNENVLNLDEKRRKCTILRVDGGGGTDGNINWALGRGYFWMSKVKNWQRTSKLVAPITDWQCIPELPGHEVAWVPQTAPVRKTNATTGGSLGKTQRRLAYCVLVFNLTDEMLCELAGRQWTANTEQELLSIIVKAYNLRSGGVETSFKNSKQGLGLNKRNKKSFQAQRVLILLAQLAYNITAWVRTELAKHKPELQHYGMVRMIRDAFSISGKLYFDTSGRLVQIVLNKTHSLAKTFRDTWLSSFVCNDLLFILDEI